jgi:hypothetical protein
MRKIRPILYVSILVILLFAVFLKKHHFFKKILITQRQRTHPSEQTQKINRIKKDVNIIQPELTDPNINTYLHPHIAYRNLEVPGKDKLFVFLPGTEAKPSGVKQLLKVVADTGTSIIGLSYPNEPSVRDLCRNDSECYGKVREEVIYGADTSPLVNINRANSIMNRLIKLLQYLDRQSPEEGWGEFLMEGNQVNWAKIIIAGHSQGGGHAAFIAKNHLVSRVVTLAAPFDSPNEPEDPHIKPASWLLEPHVTPGNRYYGFGHVEDFALTVLVPIWRTLQYPGEPVNVDKTNPPYNNSHQLYTALEPSAVKNVRIGIQKEAHMMIVSDIATPLDKNGEPVFAPVWRYMCCQE